MRTGLAARAQQAFADLGRALAAAGAGRGQVAKITIYIAGHRHEYLPAIDAARAEVCSRTTNRQIPWWGRDAGPA